MSGDAFIEGPVETAGERIRYRQAGQGPALIALQTGEAPEVTAAHTLLARRFRVLVIATPLGCSSAALEGVARGLDVESCSVMGRGPTAAAVLGLALAVPGLATALVLDTPDVVEPSLTRRLPEIATPALVLAGTRDADVAGPARACRAGLPNGHLVYVYDAGRAIAAERPEAFAEVVGDFLERRDAFVISATRTVINP
jgi:pimeloyl-ACP methyl ester carboxylesterase